MCTDFTYDDCDENHLIGLHYLSDVTTVEECQQFCSATYPQWCIFFVFKKYKNACYLSDQAEEKTLIQRCRKISGPGFPSFEKCKTDLEKPCSVSK